MEQLRQSVFAFNWLLSILAGTGAILWARLLVDGVIRLQHMLVEDFEYYAVYESNYYDLAVSFVTFKPFEYACELSLGLAALQAAVIVRSCIEAIAKPGDRESAARMSA